MLQLFNEDAILEIRCFLLMKIAK